MRLHDRWSQAAGNLNLVGKWRCDDDGDGSFVCEFTRDGVFRITADNPNTAWGIWAKDLDGLPYYRDYSGFSIPAGRCGGESRYKSGINYGDAFALGEASDRRFTTGALATDGKQVEITLDSHFLAIVYEKMIWERIE